MTRLETGLLIMVLACVGALRVLVVTGRCARSVGLAIVRLARFCALWTHSRYLAWRQARNIRRNVRALRVNNQSVIVQFTNKPRFPKP